VRTIVTVAAVFVAGSAVMSSGLGRVLLVGASVLVVAGVTGVIVVGGVVARCLSRGRGRCRCPNGGVNNRRAVVVSNRGGGR